MDYVKTKKEKENKLYSLIICFGILLVFMGISLLIYNNNVNKRLQSNDNQKIEEFFEQESETEEVVEDVPSTEKVETKEVVVDYIAILEIPKINLKRGLVNKNSSQNNVNRNIYMLQETTLPDEQENSHILLAAHSGNSYISFFKNLNKLKNDDNIFLYYKNVKYIYSVVNIYEIEKTGKATFLQTNTSDIMLVTCISNTNKQIVYVAKLVDKIAY